MGLFSSSYKYYAYAGSTSLFEKRPTTLRDTILEAGIAKESISTAVRFALMTDLGARGSSAVKYAIKKYIRGLPSTDQQQILIPEEVVIDSIEASLNITLTEFFWLLVGKPNEAFLVSKHIKDVYLDPAYFPWPSGDPSDSVWDEEKDFVEIPVVNPDTGTYYITENVPVFYRDGYQPGVDYDFLQGLTPDEYAQFSYLDMYESKYKVGYAYTDNLGDPQVWIMTPLLDLTIYDGQELIQVKYRKDTTPDETEYWVYVIGSDLDAGLEASIVTAQAEATFMPVVVMMQDKIWFNEDPESQLAITTNRLLKKFAMKGDKIREDFEEQVEEDNASGDNNKSNAEAWDFFIHFSVPISTRVRGSLEYLYAFFHEMAKNQQYSLADYQTYLGSKKPTKNGYTLPAPVSEINITEAGVNGYNVKYGWSYIYSETFDGQFVDQYDELIRPNHYASEMFKREQYNDAEYRVGIDQIHGKDPLLLIGEWSNYEDPEADNKHKNGYHDYIILTKQFYDKDTDTWWHTRIIIMALSMMYTINTREENIGVNGYRFRYVEPHMFDINTETGERTEEFRIPIHLGVLNNHVSRIHEEEVLGDAMCSTVFLVDKIKVPWYQKGFWKWLIVIVAIILIVLSFIYPPLLILANLLAGLALGWALIVVLLYFVLMFAIGMIMSLAAQTITEEFGTVAGALFRVIATIAVARQTGGLSWGNTASFGGAMQMIATTASYVNMGVQVYSAYALQQLQDEMENFTRSLREKYQELQDRWDGLGDLNEDGVDPLDLHRAFQFGNAEYPNSYYQRVLNPNPGLLGYDLINNYSALALNLPQDMSDSNIIDLQMDTFAEQRGQV